MNKASLVLLIFMFGMVFIYFLFVFVARENYLSCNLEEKGSEEFWCSGFSGLPPLIPVPIDKILLFLISYVCLFSLK